MNTPSAEQLRKASEILKAEIPQPRVGKTVDEFKGLNWGQRKILCEVSKIYPPRLNQINPR